MLDPNTRLESSQLNLRECLHDWNDSLVSVAGSRGNVPEYNDCQRFIVTRIGAGLIFDELYAIFADSALETLSQRLGLEEEEDGEEEDEGDKEGRREGEGRRKKKGGEKEKRHGSKQGPASIRRSGLLAAEIYAEGSYGPLGIKPGFNCLYVSHSGRFRAKIVEGVTQNPKQPHCPLSVNLAAVTGTTLEVRATSFQGLTFDDYPPVARWDWDPVRQEQYIGIKCGTAWCEIGRKGFRSSPGFAPPPDLPPAQRRIWLVKGWYDEQLLAVNQGDQVSVSPIKGTVFPDPALGIHSMADFAAGWRPVAHVALSNDDQTYEDKLNFAGTPSAYGTADFPLNVLNTIEYCTDQCLDLPSPSPPCNYGPLPAPDNDWGWVRIRQPNQGTGDYKYKCVPRWPYEGSGGVPATARWRWVAKDETTWTRCDQGCCEVH